jgi:tRNA A-37 threonylcarbamoyl transferase component Bud32/tetratricopeptide (TPR) repeat protein
VGDRVDVADPLLDEGTRVGDFRIRGFLGEGAMGQVYVAQDVTLDRRVALKFIKRSVMQGGGMERFLEEARATATFNHPHIVTLHAVGEHEGRPYLALEYLDGESLRARLAAGPLPIGEALRCCRAVAEAIAEAHRRGLVHADLKPENIVIPLDGRVRVVDFGVAKLVGSEVHSASGTPAYMAPERWQGTPPTGAIDVWALGVTLHELITGRLPIGDKTLRNLAFVGDTLELPELPAVPWAQLVRDCLALDPRQRPTAQEVIQRIDGLRDPSPPPSDGNLRDLAALATHARHLMTDPSTEEVLMVRGILLALVTPDDGRQPCLRGALLDGLPAASRAAVEALIESLIDRGLIVASRDATRDDITLELAYEALATAWPQDARWLDQAITRDQRHDRGVDQQGHGAPADGEEQSAEVPRTTEAKSLAITGSERRLVAVMLVGTAEEREAPALDDGALRRAIRPYGGHREHLADGTTLVMLEAEQLVPTDQALQAARCALALRALVQERPIAIAMGRADASRRPEGEVIDRGSRLLAQAAKRSGAPPPIALDEMSAGLLDARFDVIEHEAGFVLCGERALMRGARTLVGRPTSCVGRDWELGALMGILDECIDESAARVVVVTAAAGMGKSRLAAELVSRVQQRSDEVAIWAGRGDSVRAGSTLDLLAQALREALGIGGGEPLAERREKIWTRVAERLPAGDQRRVAEFLGELVGAPFPDDLDGGGALKAARQDALLMSEQMRKAWMDFLLAETAARPILLLLEDLHWGDFGTVRFIDAALRDRGDRPWMVLALARPEVFETFPKLWAERQNVQEIRLRALGRKAAERLVHQVLGDSVGPETLDRLVQQSEGNAFYLEELIRTVAEGKDRALPETVLAMVEMRLARLPLDARRVLRAASVFGEVCWEGGVTVLLERALGAAVVSEWLTRLVEQELLTVPLESRFAGERELKFRHALLREGSYATLTDKDRRLGHRLAGTWLEQHGEAEPMVLAGHYERGGEGARAAGYYLRAAEHAFHVLDLDAAMTRADLGLRCDPPEDLRLALLGMRCDVSCQDVRLISITRADAEELMRLTPRGSVPWAQGAAAYFEGAIAAAKIEDLSAEIAQLQEVDPAPEAVGKMALVLVAGIFTLDHLGRGREGSALEDRFFTIVRPTWDREPLARTWWNITLAMRASYAHEDLWKALEHSDALQEIVDTTGNEHAFLNMQLFRGMNLWFLGELASAERALEAIAAADESLGMVSAWRRFSLSWLRADRGALDEARALAAQLSDHGRAHQLPLDEGRGRWVLAEVLRRMGDLEGAERELQVALEMVTALERPGALGTLSALRLAQGRPQDALAAAEDAVSRCRAMGGCGMFRGAFVQLAHAEALHATGAHDAARRAITEAQVRLLVIAAQIADPDYKRSFLENIPENARTLALARAWLGEAVSDA